jgi:hypothetical protein
MTIVCVLRLGGDFTREWVYALRRGLNRHVPSDAYEFVCLTNDTLVPNHWRRPLKYDWPKWWSKLHLFEPGLFDGPVLYVDLDTLPVGDLSDIMSYRGDFAMLNDFYRAKNAQSGVMAWTPGPVTEKIWDTWMHNPAHHTKRIRGDGEFLHAISKPDRLQALYPGQIVSLKVHCKPPKASGPPAGARLVCGHGRPRFNTPAAGWAHREWLRIDGQTERKAA